MICDSEYTLWLQTLVKGVKGRPRVSTLVNQIAMKQQIQQQNNGIFLSLSLSLTHFVSLSLSLSLSVSLSLSPCLSVCVSLRGVQGVSLFMGSLRSFSHHDR